MESQCVCYFMLFIILCFYSDNRFITLSKSVTRSVLCCAKFGFLGKIRQKCCRCVPAASIMANI